MSEMARDLGRHDAQIEALQVQVDRLHGDMGNVLSELQKINRTLNEARGGWRTLIAVGAVTSFMTTVVLTMLGWLKPH
jgi:prefoldin subunit 5